MSQELTAVPGGRLSRFQEAWRKMLGSGPIQQVIRQGHRIEFSKTPPLSQPGEGKETRLAKDKMILIRKEVKDLVRKKVVRRVPWQEARRKPGYYSKMFCVSKANGSWRPIINLRPMNRFVQKEKFKMETMQNVRELLRPGLWGATIDLKDAFYHVGIHRKSRKFLRFLLDGQVYEYMALPMGLTCSPRVFTTLNKKVGVVFRKHGITCVFYIDNILVTGETEEDCRSKDYVCPAVTPEPGVFDKLRQVGPPAQQEIPIPGHVVGHDGLDSQPLRRARGWTEEPGNQTEEQRLLNLQTGGQYDWQSTECDLCCPSGQGSHQADSSGSSWRAAPARQTTAQACLSRRKPGRSWSSGSS